MGFSSGPAYTPPPPAPMPPPAAHPAVLGSASVALSGSNAAKKYIGAEAGGFNDTVKTSSQGDKGTKTLSTPTILGS